MRLRTQNNWGNADLEAKGLSTVRIERLNSGGTMMVPLLAQFSDDQWSIELLIDISGGEFTCTRYTVARSDGQPLQLFTTDIATGFNLRKMMSHAVVRHALEPVEGGDGGKFRRATSDEALEAVLGPVRRTRTSVTQELLEEIVEAYKTRYERGRMAEFAESFGYGKRRMNDLLNEAEDRGIMEPRSERRKR